MAKGGQALWWTLAAVALFGALWLVGRAAAPFIAGAAIAYLLDPLAGRLERLGASRTLAASAIALGALALAAAALVLLIPLVIAQAGALIDAMPGWIASAQRHAERLAGDYGLGAEEGAFDAALEALEAQAQDWSGALVSGVFTSGLALIDFLALVVIAPIVAFYLLLDWPRMIAEIDGWLPRRHADAIRAVARDLDTALAGFVRGQLAVCAILGAFYAAALGLVGLQFGLVVGLFAGLVSFIPFAGSFLGGALSMGLALDQFWGDWLSVGLVAAIFLAGQAVEGNYLTPRLVGRSIGLHPVWLMFALAAFGSLFGFTGLLIAAPAAAAIGVLARLGLARYREGALYLGDAGRNPGDPDRERRE
ncbi:MAG: AI-2E family transporter [Rhodobacteraceae bacterium]|nr:MAG: AI-2E family transporter [Paracoccaceae bacterium]